MKYIKWNTLVMTVAIVGLVVLGSLDSVAGETSAPARLLSAQPHERAQALATLTAEHQLFSKMMQETLKNASTNSRMDCRYHSPLHSAIIAVQECEVLDSTGMLLTMVDYELDPRSFPVGMDVPGYAFFPAAQALVRLRVNVADILRVLAAANGERTRRVLTWILLERAGGVRQAEQLLLDYAEQKHGITEKNNCIIALDLLESPSEILPMPLGK